MIISEFPEMNAEYGKPKDMEHSECQSLPAFKAEDRNLIISCWKFTPQELLIALIERKMWLHVHLNFQPSVLITPEYPFLKADGSYDNIEIAVNYLLDRKIQQFLEKYPTVKDGFDIHDTLKEFAEFLVSTGEK